MRYLPVLGVIALVVAALGAATSSTTTAGSATVTDWNDTGAGSFRAAIELANDNATIGNVVLVGNLDPNELQSPVFNDGSQSLMIVGDGAVVEWFGSDWHVGRIPGGDAGQPLGHRADDRERRRVRESSIRCPRLRREPSTCP